MKNLTNLFAKKNEDLLNGEISLDSNTNDSIIHRLIQFAFSEIQKNSLV